jgi:hypothetical protein
MVRRVSVITMYFMVGVGLFAFLQLLVGKSYAQAQRSPIECGTILEAEFTPDNTSHFYTVELVAGDSITVKTDPIGDFLDIAITVLDPRDSQIKKEYSTNGRTVELTTTLSASGRYTINVYGHQDNPIGAYALYLGCTLRDGTVIAPGDAVPMPSEPVVEEPVEVPTFSGFGFPGLAPVDFSTITRLPLIEGVPLSGVITPTGGEIIGFTAGAEAGNVLDLRFTRLSGNLNLGIVVLSPDNKVEFQVSLITSNTFSTQIVLPITGEYIVGVFRIELNPPENPEGTAFQVQMQLQ